MADDRFEPVTFEDAIGEHETDRGLLVLVDGETAWLPKSQLCDDSEVREAGDRGDLVIPRWLAEDKGARLTGPRGEHEQARSPHIPIGHLR